MRLLLVIASYYSSKIIGVLLPGCESRKDGCLQSLSCESYDFLKSLRYGCYFSSALRTVLSASLTGVFVASPTALAALRPDSFFFGFHDEDLRKSERAAILHLASPLHTTRHCTSILQTVLQTLQYKTATTRSSRGAARSPLLSTGSPSFNIDTTARVRYHDHPEIRVCLLLLHLSRRAQEVVLDLPHLNSSETFKCACYP